MVRKISFPETLYDKNRKKTGFVGPCVYYRTIFMWVEVLTFPLFLEKNELENFKDDIFQGKHFI